MSYRTMAVLSFSNRAELGSSYPTLLPRCILVSAVPPTTMTAIRILCVDDDPHINELNEIVLTQAGYQVESAASPEDALARFQDHTFDLVVTDLFSPQSSNAAFISKLRNVAPSLPIIIVSGNDSPPPEILKQVDAFVQKAYSLNALTNAIREVLMREKLRRIG